MRRHPLPAFSFAAALLVACSAPAAVRAGDARLPQAVTRPLPALEDATWVWDTRASQWRRPAGRYRMHVGASSRILPLAQEVEVRDVHGD